VEDTLRALFASVCQALLSAGYEISATDPTLPGLYVTGDGPCVRIRWTPSAELMTPGLLRAEHDTPPLPGMRDAVHTALTTVLATAGFTLVEPDEPNTLRITGTTIPA